MTTAAHTPGPWRTKSGPGWIETYIVGELVGAHEPSIATVKSVYVDHGSYIANARLIAAAPELLAALQSALAVIEDYLEYTHDGDPWKEDARTMGEMDINDYHGDGRLESARAAIAKAIGAAS